MLEKSAQTLLESVNDGIAMVERITDKAVNGFRRTADVAKVSLRLDKEEHELGRLFYELGYAVFSGRARLNLDLVGLSDMVLTIEKQQETVARTKDELLITKNACVTCGGKLPADGLFCPHCGRKQETGTKEGKRTCQACDKEVTNDAVFCPGCGKRLDGEAK